MSVQELYRNNQPLSQIQHLYQLQISDLGDIDERLRGIFSPGYDQALVAQYMTTQFREEAQTYVEKYQKTDYFANLLSTAFEKIGLRQEQRSQLTILDIGSGAGNSVFPLMELCPDSMIIASDLSVELLALLKQVLLRQQLHNNCHLLQLNAEELNFTERTFDLVVGAATLHHLFTPEKALQGCAQILKKGGWAIFFEPFENGHALLSLAYRDILKEEPQRPRLPEESRGFLVSRIQEYEMRKGRDKSRPEFALMDDKWFFTRQYFWELAEKWHFSDCLIYPLYPLELAKQQFVLQTEINLRLALGKDRDALPDWAWQIIQQYDDIFSEDLKKEMLLEGTVLLKK